MKCQTVVFEVQDEGAVNNGIANPFSTRWPKGKRYRVIEQPE
jgi:hypothetical protein